MSVSHYFIELIKGYQNKIAELNFMTQHVCLCLTVHLFGQFSPDRIFLWDDMHVLYFWKALGTRMLVMVL